MPHSAGERLICNECGAEILFVKPCPCPKSKPKTHSDICCEKEMSSLGIVSEQEFQEVLFKMKQGKSSTEATAL